MAYALSLASWLAIGGAGCLALASLSRDLRAIPSQWRALQAALKDIDQCA